MDAAADRFARFVATLGRGPGRSRALTRAEAREAYREALAIRRKLFPRDDPTVSSALNDLITVLVVERKYDEAEQLFNEAQAPFVAGQPPNIGFLRLRVEAEAQSCRFRQANSAFTVKFAAKASSGSERQPTPTQRNASPSIV